MNYDVASAIIRIGEMERYFDVLCSFAKVDPKAVFSHPHLKELLDKLVDYYDGGQWLEDYRADEKGLFPDNLKRGVLSQDGIYNLLEKLHVKNEK